MATRNSRSADNDSPSARVKLVEAITTPLGFFVLALLIVEAFLATVLIGAELTPADKMSCVMWGIWLFIMVVALVFILVWWRPSNLTFDKDAHLVDRGKTPYGTEKQPINSKDLFSSAKTEESK